MTSLLSLFLVACSSVAPVKVTVDGDGYLRFIRDGRVVFAKSAVLTDVNGYLGSKDAKLLPSINLPGDVRELKVDLMGNVQVDGTKIGRLVLATFPAGSTGLPDSSFLTFQDRATLVNPGEDTAGVIRLGEPKSTDTAVVAATISDPKPTVQSVATAVPKATKPKLTTTPTSTTDGEQVSIAVREHSDVIGKAFTLGDIASITGPADQVDVYKKIRIGETAVAGVTRYVDQHYIGLKLLGAGHQVGTYALNVPDKAEVVRKSKTVTSDEIIEFAIKAAQAKVGNALSLKTSNNVDPIIADDGDITLETSDPERTQKGFSMVVTAREGNNIVGTRTVILAASGDSVQIKVGDTVTVLLKCGTASIETTGKALTAGYLGEHIQIAITASGGEAQAKTTTHTAVIVDTGKVEVNL